MQFRIRCFVVASTSVVLMILEFSSGFAIVPTFRLHQHWGGLFLQRESERFVESQEYGEERTRGKYWSEDRVEDYHSPSRDSTDPQRKGKLQSIPLDWESCSDNERNALVLLPPEEVQRPTAILHFVGAAFVGSAPKLWYRSLLEKIVLETQAAVIVTPIPMSLSKSPLHHISTAQTLQESLEYAWTTVIEDEYGDVSDIPLCGVGHSLGARLLVVLSTLTKNKGTRLIPPYRSFALIGFTNTGAHVEIPGIGALSQYMNRVQNGDERIGGHGKNILPHHQGVARPITWSDLRNPSRSTNGWEEFLESIHIAVQDQADRIRQAVFPDASTLEYHPSPNMLWTALQDDLRYAVPQTLLIQFDDDPLDQSSKLARILHDTNSSDVKFARIRGNHMTPISVDETETGAVSTKISQAVWDVVNGQSNRDVIVQSRRELYKIVSRYVLDLATA